MKRNWKILLSVLLAAVLLLSVWPGIADFGDFSGDSDYGGGSDWGSDYDSGSSWDYDSGSSWDYDSRDYSGTRNSSSRSGSGSGAGIVIMFMVGGLIVILFLLRYASSGNNTTSPSNTRTAARPAQPTWGFQMRQMSSMPEEADWNTDREKEMFKNLYRQMQKAWEAGDLTPLREDFTADAYTQYDRQLKEKTARGEQAHCRVISVKATPEGWNENAHEWMLAVTVKAVIIAWNTNKYGEIISGSDSFKKSMVYAWVLRKPKNATEGKLHCPNCGAEVEINAGTECPMCGAELEAPGKGWQLSSIQGISQKTLK